MNAPAVDVSTMTLGTSGPQFILPSKPSSFSLYSAEAMAAVEFYGKMLAKSGFFGTSSNEQCMALVFFAMSENESIVELKRKYHVISRDLTMRADYMLAEFRRLGGDYHWVDMGDSGERAVLWMKYKSNEAEVVFTLDDAKKQGLVKPNSNWIKNPGAQLRARVQTKGVRALAPEVLAGFCTDDELQGNDSDDIPSGVSLTVGESNGASLVARMHAEKAAKAAAVEQAEHASAESASQERSTETLKQELQKQLDGMATPEQIAELNRLLVVLSIPTDAQHVAFAKRGVSTAADLTSDQITEMIANLQTMVAPNTDHMQSTDGTTVIETDGPITKELEAELRSLINEVAQMPNGMVVVTGLKEHLDNNGLMLVDLTFNEGRKMKAALEKKQLEIFTSLMLTNSTAAGGETKN